MVAPAMEVVMEGLTHLRNLPFGLRSPPEVFQAQTLVLQHLCPLVLRFLLVANVTQAARALLDLLDLLAKLVRMVKMDNRDLVVALVIMVQTLQLPWESWRTVFSVPLDLKDLLVPLVVLVWPV